MIAFASLFLGLVLGLQPVQLVVGEEVATVEVHLNGRLVGTLTDEPWTLPCDFGTELAPRELVAVARDSDGEELGRTRQWINLPPPPAEAEMVLDRDAEGRRIVRLAWESLAGDTPRRVAVTFDGDELEITDPRAFPLPPHDERQLHFLRVELEFSDTVDAVLEVTLGGTFVDRINTELTAVPVVGKRASELAAGGRHAGRLVKDGEPLDVVAVEKGPAQLLVVQDRSSRPLLEDLTRFATSSDVTATPLQRAWRLRGRAQLYRDQRLRFLWPVPQRRQGSQVAFDLFMTSANFEADDGGFCYLLHRPENGMPEGPQRLADAVATAALHVAGRNRRRAVLLLLGDDPRDASQLTPQRTRRYLERLRVPLVVWSLTGDRAPGPWGPARDVSSLSKFERATADLGRAVDQQRVVWVAGAHLPQQIELAAEIVGIELAK